MLCASNPLQFEEVLNQPAPKDDISKLVDPRLGDNYLVDSVRKVIHLPQNYIFCPIFDMILDIAFSS